MAVLPTDPLFSKVLVTALKPCYAGVRGSIISIVSMLSVENVFHSTESKKVLKQRASIMNRSSDHLALLNIFDACQKLKVKERKGFCTEAGINYKSVQKAELIAAQLHDYCK